MPVPVGAKGGLERESDLRVCVRWKLELGVLKDVVSEEKGFLHVKNSVVSLIPQIVKLLWAHCHPLPQVESYKAGFGFRSVLFMTQ